MLSLLNGLLCRHIIYTIISTQSISPSLIYNWLISLHFPNSRLLWWGRSRYYLNQIIICAFGLLNLLKSYKVWSSWKTTSLLLITLLMIRFPSLNPNLSSLYPTKMYGITLSSSLDLYSLRICTNTLHSNTIHHVPVTNLSSIPTTYWLIATFEMVTDPSWYLDSIMTNPPNCRSQ